MSEIKWFLLLLAVGFLILLFRHIQLKKQIRNLSGQVKEWNRGNSGQMIDISLMDKDLEHLAAILNLYNIGQRQAVAKTLRHEEHLKESVANISHDLAYAANGYSWSFTIVTKRRFRAGAGQTHRSCPA